MPHRHAISDADWDRLKDLLPGRPGQPGWVAKDNRLFLDAVLWVAKTGAPGATCRSASATGTPSGSALTAGPRRPPGSASLRPCKTPTWSGWSSTRPSSAPTPTPPARKKADGTGGQSEQALGRSRGGFGTKIHAGVSGLGLPVRLVLTAGQEADVSQGEKRIAGLPIEVVIADKGYDSKRLARAIRARGAEAVIPSLCNRKEQRPYDKDRYRDRNLAERFWSKVKQYRRVATRYEKTGRNFLAFVQVASIMVLLK